MRLEKEKSASDGRDERSEIGAALQRSGIEPSPDEIQSMVRVYRSARNAIASFYAVPGVRYEDPAISFDPRVEK